MKIALVLISLILIKSCRGTKLSQCTHNCMLIFCEDKNVNAYRLKCFKHHKTICKRRICKEILGIPDDQVVFLAEKQCTEDCHEENVMCTVNSKGLSQIFGCDDNWKLCVKRCEHAREQKRLSKAIGKLKNSIL